ncbi:MAG: hypothetical protein KDD62_02705, partial [Bdellovibrionales bacterium]|nr:hypothetical protein [Bdellovibrionales bacterium]
MDNEVTEVLWRPSEKRSEGAAVRRFIKQINVSNVSDFHTLYQWSVRYPKLFWEACIEFLDIQFSSPARCTLEFEGDMRLARWFPGATLNFAENLLRNRSADPAIVFWGEDVSQKTLSYEELYQAVAQL